MPESRIHLRGFASLPKERVREISILGGRRVQESGRGHVFSSDEAREAGRKGGAAKAANRAKQAGA
jgi:uncharacterized protein